MSILDPNFKYVPAVKTDIRKTFERAQRDLNQKHESARFAPLLPQQQEVKKSLDVTVLRPARKGKAA